jgi:insulysin
MYVVEEFDKARIQEMSELLTNPKNTNIYLRSKTFEKQPELCPITDPWYYTKYGKEAFPSALFSRMTSPNVSGKKPLDLPPPNVLLPKSLDMLSSAAPGKPTLLKQWADDTDLWYLKDDKFQRPKGVVSLKIYTGDNEFGRTALGRVFAEVWNQVLQEHLREFYYMAQMASLHASMSLPHDNYNLQWTGFSDSLPRFVEETLKRMRDLKVEDQPEAFAQVKEKLLQEWANFYLEQTFRQGVFLFENVMLSTAFEKKQLRAILETLTFEDFVRMSKHWLKSARFVWFIHGNLSQE